MDVTKELEKISKILKSKSFTYKGTDYKLQMSETKKHTSNIGLKGKPLIKLVGINVNKEVVAVWSHDCEVKKSKK